MAKLLVIDDDDQVRQVLKEHLTNEGHEVTTASRALEGLSEAQKATPDLILLDVMLPDETGFQTCGKLRSNPETRHTPIIMMSGTARSTSQQSLGRLMGANEYFLKPLNVIEVGDKVHELLNFSPQAPVQRVVQEPIKAEKPALVPIPPISLDRLFSVMQDELNEPSPPKE